MGYELIETIEVGSGGAASIEFTSIPQDGVDLVIKASPRVDSGTFSGIQTRLNSDSGANYSTVRINGSGTSASSTSRTDENQFDQININGSSSTADTFSSHQIYISNYISSADKSISIESVAENNATSGQLTIQAAKYSTSSAITSVLLYSSGNDFVEYSSASLYKITDA